MDYDSIGRSIRSCESGFELKGTATIDDKEQEVRAWADYWGTGRSKFQDVITPTTVFNKSNSEEIERITLSKKLGLIR